MNKKAAIQIIALLVIIILIIIIYNIAKNNITGSAIKIEGEFNKSEVSIEFFDLEKLRAKFLASGDSIYKERETYTYQTLYGFACFNTIHMIKGSPTDFWGGSLQTPRNISALLGVEPSEIYIKEKDPKTWRWYIIPSDWKRSYKNQHGPYGFKFSSAREALERGEINKIDEVSCDYSPKYGRIVDCEVEIVIGGGVDDPGHFAVGKYVHCDIPKPSTCDLKEVIWASSEADIGKPIVIGVAALNCNNELINFFVREADTFGGDDLVRIEPKSARIEDDIAISVWEAEWQNDCNGLCNPPEYYVIAQQASNPKNIIKSFANLTVNKRI